MNHRNNKSNTSGSELKLLRRKSRLSLADIARHYRRGVTRGRIAQIEAVTVVTESTDRDYRVAVVAAAHGRERSRRIFGLAKVLADTL
jgi:ribosomal protein S3AE